MILEPCSRALSPFAPDESLRIFGSLFVVAEVERRAGVAVAEVEGEPLGSSSADAGEGEVIIAEVESEPLGSSSTDAGEGRSRRSPKADGEPLEPNSIGEGETEVAVAEVDGEPLELKSVVEGETEVAIEAETTSTRQDLFTRRCWSPAPYSPSCPEFVVEAA